METYSTGPMKNLEKSSKISNLFQKIIDGDSLNTLPPNEKEKVVKFLEQINADFFNIYQAGIATGSNYDAVKKATDSLDSLLNNSELNRVLDGKRVYEAFWKNVTDLTTELNRNDPNTKFV